jgi:phosphoribosylformylglycinamidine synthase subunit PurS
MPAFRVEIRVMPRASLLDPQGQAVSRALQALGFADVAEVRVGKHVVVRLDAATRDAAAARARSMCDRLLANAVTEDYQVLVEAA